VPQAVPKVHLVLPVAGLPALPRAGPEVSEQQEELRAEPVRRQQVPKVHPVLRAEFPVLRAEFPVLRVPRDLQADAEA
jgi:hypothetical protein